MGPDLGPNCLHLGYQQTTKVCASQERVNCEVAIFLGLCDHFTP